MPYTILALAIANNDVPAAAVILLSVAADNVAAKEQPIRAPQTAQETARRPARQPERL